MERRPTTTLKRTLERNLLAYAAAAGATSLGIAGMAGSAEARVVYTPVHKVISPNTILKLDLNHDGLSDFRFSQTFYSTVVSHFRHSSLNIQAAKRKNRIIGAGKYASALRAGVSIGSAGPFPGQDNVMARFYNPDSSYQWYGRWANYGKGVKNRYLGLKFTKNGTTRFGWARLTVETNGGTRMRAVLTGYAYETKANKPIVAGDEGAGAQSLGHLALGSPRK
jgi:hypothetical protein